MKKLLRFLLTATVALATACTTQIASLEDYTLSIYTPSYASGFEIAGADRIFHPATARIRKGNGRLIVSSEAVAEPVAVRYAFRNYAEATLFNSSGIPASSFRTDDWDE